MTPWKAALVALLATIHFPETWAFLHQASRWRRTTQLTAAADEISRQDASSSRRPIGFQVAPMQCYTNLALRTLLQDLSPSSTLWTEMEKVTDILGADANGLERRFGPPFHKDIVLQVGGNDPGLLRQCLQHLEQHGYSFDEINLNCGCPSIESGGAATYGASLMKDADLTARLVEALAEHSTADISVKCRIGVYETVQDWEVATESEEDQLQFLQQYIEPSLQVGLTKLHVHARPTILAGLSPTKNRQVPKLDYEVVEALADISTVPVTLNGGIQGWDDYCQLCDRAQRSSISDLMAGRWILRRPLDLSRVEGDLQHPSMGDNAESVPIQRASDAVAEYSNYALHCLEASSRGKDPRLPTIPDLVLPLFLVMEQLHEEYDMWEEINDDEEENGITCVDDNLWLPVEDLEDIYDNVCETLSSMEEILDKKPTKFSPTAIQFNKVASSIKSLTGTKVANKWKRNRAEL